MDLWAVVGGGYFTMDALETTATLDDVDRALAIMSMKGELEADAVARATKGK